MDTYSEQHSWTESALGSIFANGLRILSRTWRKKVEGLEILDQLTSERQPHFVAFWHGKYIQTCALLRGRGAGVITSRSHRGNVIAEVAQRLEYSVVQIPDEPKKSSIDLLRNSFSLRLEVGVAIDGPLGPEHVVKSGVVHLASRLNCAIVPVSVSARSRHVFKGRWDHLEIPCPFTRVCLVIGRPIVTPDFGSRDDCEHWCQRLHDALEEVDREAKLCAGRKIRRHTASARLTGRNS